MTRTSRLSIGFVGCLVVASTVIAGGVLKGQEGQEYESSSYLSGQSSKELTIKSREGKVLVVLQVPVGMELSIHVVKSEVNKTPVKTGAQVFSGDLSIRALPSSQLREGSLRLQMMQAPVQLDLLNVVAELVQK